MMGQSRLKMSLKKATPVEVIDGNSFRLRTDAIIILDGVDVPDKATPEGQKAKAKLAELVLHKKVEYETKEWTPMGQTKANVTLDGVNINAEMKKFVAAL
jgi:endonuclease YncB( thermonuclease family)